jgi:hypothetical protein
MNTRPRHAQLQVGLYVCDVISHACIQGFIRQRHQTDSFSLYILQKEFTSQNVQKIRRCVNTKLQDPTLIVARVAPPLVPIVGNETICDCGSPHSETFISNFVKIGQLALKTDNFLAE